MRNAVAVIGLL